MKFFGDFRRLQPQSFTRFLSVKSILVYTFLVFSLQIYAQNYFDLDTQDSLFRIENQRFGESITYSPDYKDYPFLYQCAANSPYNTERFNIENAGGGYYRLHHVVSGKYLESPNASDGDRIAISGGTGGDSKLWEIVLVDPKGLYTIKSKSSGLYLSAEYDFSEAWLPYLKKMQEGKAVQRSFIQGDKDFLWAIDPERPDVINCVGMSQIGWEPSSRKIAVLNRTAGLGYDPTFTVTKNGATVYSGIATHYKDVNGTTQRYQLEYYIMNLTPIRDVGTYQLSVEGQSVEFEIRNDAYTRLRTRFGHDYSRFADFFNPDYGFITEWGRMANWYDDYHLLEYGTPGQPVSWNYPYYQKLTVQDSSPNNNQYSDIQPQKRLDNVTMGKGWNHTDQQWGFFEPTAVTQLLLVELWRENPDPDAVSGIQDEILYGVDSLLAIEHPDGNFPQNTFCDNAYTGTVASCGMALAASYEPLKSFYPEKAQEVLAGAQKAWEWVEAHNSVSDWVPYQTQYYRYGFAQMRMGLNVELYIITGDSKYKTIADNMILNSEFDGLGVWRSTGTRFPGEEAFPSHTTQLGLFRYYPYADQNVRDAIKIQISDLCSHWASGAAVDGPYNEGTIHNFGASYDYAFNAYTFYKAYELFGDQFTYAYRIAQKRTDWLFGFNQFATSLTFGAGDIFACHGYHSGYRLGRLVPGIIIENGDKITASNHAYNIGESGAASQPVMMLCLAMREKLKNRQPPVVTMYPDKNFAGNPVTFCAEDWQGYKILKEGMHLYDIESMKIPQGFSVELFSDENL